MQCSAAEVEGSILELPKISRLDMGVYFCIAANGVPPSKSKRIFVSVDCKLQNYFYYYYYYYFKSFYFWFVRGRVWI